MVTAVWIFGSAAFYTATMILMKMWGDGVPRLLMAAGILGFFVLAAWFEILALRIERLGLIYVSILAVEVVMIAAVSVVLFGETFSAREVAGAALIVAGTALAWS